MRERREAIAEIFRLADAAVDEVDINEQRLWMLGREVAVAKYLGELAVVGVGIERPRFAVPHQRRDLDVQPLRQSSQCRSKVRGPETSDSIAVRLVVFAERLVEPIGKRQGLLEVLKTDSRRSPVIAIQRIREGRDEHFIGVEPFHPFERLEGIAITLRRELLEDRQVDWLVH